MKHLPGRHGNEKLVYVALDKNQKGLGKWKEVLNEE